MLEVFIGMAIIVVPVLFTALGYIIGKKHHKNDIEEEKDEKVLRESKAVEDHFNNLMNYDVNQAYTRKVI